jgi:hypothetical protein
LTAAIKRPCGFGFDADLVGFAATFWVRDDALADADAVRRTGFAARFGALFFLAAFFAALRGAGFALFFADFLAPRPRWAAPCARRVAAADLPADFFLAFFAVLRAMTSILSRLSCFGLFQSVWLP